MNKDICGDGVVMNIAIITPCLTRGGAERAAGLLSKRLSKYANVYLFVLDDKPITYEYGGSIENLHFSKIYSDMKLKGKKFGNIYAKFAYLKLMHAIKAKKKEYNIDCTISFLEQPNLMNIFTRTKDKVIVSVRNNKSSQNDSFIHRLENLGIKLFYNSADKVVSLSYGVTEDLIKNFGVKKDKIETIYNFFDFDDIHNSRLLDIPDSLSELFNNDIVLSMGRLNKQKNFLGLLEAVPLVVKKHPEIIFVILGSGEQESQIRERIRTLEIEKNVSLVGYCSNPFPLIANSKVFVMNSWFEGFCNSVMEALACGAMVISADCKYGPREILSSSKEYDSVISGYKVCDNGILVETGNTLELANAILRALDDVDLYNNCIQNAKKYIDSYSMDAIEKQWFDVIGLDT